MNNIDIIVTIINGGTGIGVFFNVTGNNLFFPNSGTQNIQLDPGNYVAAVAGTEPSDDTVNIQIIQNGTVLRTSNFTEATFGGLMAFTVN